MPDARDEAEGEEECQQADPANVPEKEDAKTGCESVDAIYAVVTRLRETEAFLAELTERCEA